MLTWFRNLRTVWKLMLSYGGIGLLVATVALISIAAVSDLRERLRIVYEDYTVAGTDLAHAASRLLQFRDNQQLLITSRDEATYRRQVEAQNGLREKITGSLDAYAATTLRVSRNGRDEFVDLQALRTAVAAYFEAAQLTSRYAGRIWTSRTKEEAEAAREDAKRNSSDNAGPKLFGVLSALERLVETVREVAKDMNDDGILSGRLAVQSLMIGGGVVVVLGLLIGWAIARMLARNLNLVGEAAKKLGAGELSARSSVTTRDEVGTLALAFNEMGEKLEQAAVAQKAQTAEIKGITDAISKAQATIEFNPDGTVTTANNNFLNTLGYALQEIKGQHHRIFCDPAYANTGEYSAFWQKLNRGEYHAGIYRRLGKGGREIWIQASYNPIQDANGKIYKVVKFATDITGQKRAQNEVERLIKAAAAGQLSERIKTDEFTGTPKELTDSFNRLLDSVSTPLHEAQTVLTALAANDLTKTMTGNYQGEFEQMKVSLNSALATLSTAMTTVRESAESVTAGAEQITKGNEDLAQRTSEQASSLEETSASMEEMTSTVKQNADNAKQANQLAIAARDTAEKGGSVTTRAVDAMGEINKSSKKIADIITVIDEIAFQTNLLALNAAVEAARAGEHGRGFAVVAAEVRNLAQRSATAAKEIKGLINESIQRVSDGSELVNQSGKTLEEIVSSVKRVTDIIGEITAASQEQATGIDQVNKAIMQMDETTQQNAALVEETTSASQSMKEQAKDLMRQVEVFRTLASGQSGASVTPIRRPSPTVGRPAPTGVRPGSTKPGTKKPGSSLQRPPEAGAGIAAGNGTDRRAANDDFEEF